MTDHPLVVDREQVILPYPPSAKPAALIAAYERHDLEILAFGGVRGLARVVEVLALLEVTPEKLHSLRDEDGVRIRINFVADARRADLCRARLRQLVVVKEMFDRGSVSLLSWSANDLTDSQIPT